MAPEMQLIAIVFVLKALQIEELYINDKRPKINNLNEHCSTIERK